MCNACGFLCCGSDVFERCGCDHCSCPACWLERAGLCAVCAIPENECECGFCPRPDDDDDLLGPAQEKKDTP
jgi:hypothetical protein